MKNHFKQSVLKLAVVSVFTLGSSVLGVSSHAATASATATATVLTPMTLTKTADLNFGSFTGTVGQVVVITPAGATTGSTATLANSTRTAASFNVAGTGNATYAITLSGTVNITHTNTVDTMAVSSFISSPTVGTGGTLSSGAQVLTVGATVTMGASQLAGVYTGTFNTTVEYN